MSLLLLCGQASWAGELSCDAVEPSNCTFTYKKVLFCQTEGVFDSDVNADGKLDAADVAILQDAWLDGVLVPLSGCAD